MELVKGTTYLVVRKSTDYRPGIEEFKLVDESTLCFKFAYGETGEYVKWFLKEDFENLYNIIEII